jgi:hypothetical protein
MRGWVVAGLALSMMNAGWAGLGGQPSNPGPRARVAHAGASATAPGAGYTDLERQLESGTTIHEYVDANGTVFAVSWSGPYIPDLKELLGVHFDAMVEQAGKTPRASRSQLMLKRPDLVIVSGGHMGAFQGRAWLPAQLPPGFSPGDVK